MTALLWIVAVLALLSPPGFMWCCCSGDCSTPVTVPVQVNGCGGGLAGKTVTISDGLGHTYSAVTNGSGLANIAVAHPGTYTGSYSQTGYSAAPIGPLAVVCGGTVGLTTLNLVLTTGYTCSNACCTNAGTGPYPVTTMPSTGVFNDGIGNVTLTKVASTEPSLVTWRGSATRTSSFAQDTSTCPGTGLATTVNNVSVTIYFTVTCQGFVTIEGFSGKCRGACLVSSCLRGQVPVVAGQEDFSCGPGSGAACAGSMGGFGMGATVSPGLTSCGTPSSTFSGTVTGVWGRTADYPVGAGADFLANIYGQSAGPLAGQFTTSIPFTWTT